MTYPPELHALRTAAGHLGSLEESIADTVKARNAAIVSAHANPTIPMADIYQAARLSPGMVHRILSANGAKHRPRGGRPAASGAA